MTDLAVAHDLARVAILVARHVSDEVLDMVEEIESDVLDAEGVLYAAINGMVTAALDLLKSSADAGAITDRQHKFHQLLAQAADTWQQLHGERSVASGKMQ